MPSAMVDTNYPDSDQARRLCRLLGPYTDSLPVRLWCWALSTNRENGTFEADAKQLAQIVRFESDPSVLLEAFLSCGVIEKAASGDLYRIKGWDRNKKFFSERKRLRKMRQAQKRTRTVRVQNADKTEHSSSSSSSLEELHTPRARVIDTETRARPTKPLEPFLLAEFKTLCHGHKPPRPCPENWTESDARDAGRIIAAYPNRWQALIAKFITDDFNGNVGFALSWLAKNAALVDGRTPKQGQREGPMRVDVPSVEETKARAEAERARIAAIPAEELARRESQLAEKVRSLGGKP